MQDGTLPTVAWADRASNRVTRNYRPDWDHPIALVRREDVQHLESIAAEQDERAALVALLRTRNAELELELSKARASRDAFKAKYEIVSAWMLKHVKLALVKGQIVGATVKQPDPTP